MNFCPNCGNNLGGVKTRINSMKKRLQYSVKTKVDQVKQSLDRQISDYLVRLDTEKEMQVGSVKIPEERKDSIRNALLNFQTKLGNQTVTSEEFNKWMEDLDKRLDEEKCIVCFQNWVGSTTTIVVCKHCRSGGHDDHLRGWVRDNRFCPLCRQTISVTDLITIDINKN
ncbi:MAG: hypothetical protein ACW99A_06545 [Candidatus Kariarchaeaceae archaeon]